MNAAAVVEGFLERSEIPFARAGEGRWSFQLKGDRKLTIPVGIAVSGDRVVFESFFMRRPQENADQFYGLLLQRNMRAYGVHFAVDPIGDVYIVGQRALRGLDEDELDRIVGAILIEADGLFDAAIAIGFQTYLEADMRWRAAEAARQSGKKI
jgi:putative sensory transduction regulator